MLKLNVGFSRKTGEANYGSRGASVNLELEADSSLASNPERLRDRIRYLFGLAKASVEEELHAQSTNGHRAAHTSVNGNAHPNGYHNGRQYDATRRATSNQVRALLAIARRQGRDATNIVQSQYDIDRPEDLSIAEASALIDSLKAAANGADAQR